MDRREVLKLGAATLAAGIPPVLMAAADRKRRSLRRRLKVGDVRGKSCRACERVARSRRVTLAAAFMLEHRTVQVTGFYDGEGTLQSPVYAGHAVGKWTYVTASSVPQLAAHAGGFYGYCAYYG